MNRKTFFEELKKNKEFKQIYFMVLISKTFKNVNFELNYNSELINTILDEFYILEIVFNQTKVNSYFDDLCLMINNNKNLPLKKYLAKYDVRNSYDAIVDIMINKRVNDLRKSVLETTYTLIMLELHDSFKNDDKRTFLNSFRKFTK